MYAGISKYVYNINMITTNLFWSSNILRIVYRITTVIQFYK